MPAPSPPATSTSRCRRSAEDRGRKAPGSDSPTMLRRREEAPRFLVRIGCIHVQPRHRVRLRELRRGPKVPPVQLERGHQVGGSEMRREGVRKPEHGGQAGAGGARAEDPERHLETCSGNGADRLVVPRGAEEHLQILDVPWEAIGAQGIAAECAGRQLVRSGGPPEPEVDAARVERLQRSELLGDHERRMVRQHDPAGPDPDRRRARREIAGHDGRRSARDRLHVVVLGDPVALVTEALGVAREVEAVAQRIAGGRPARDRGEVEDGEGNRTHLADVTRPIWYHRPPNQRGRHDVSVVVRPPDGTVMTIAGGVR